jgi:hypothetical protein
MVNLLEVIRAALDELESRLGQRIVDIEMPRLFVVADADALQRALVVLIDRAIEESEGDIVVRTTKQRNAARIEISSERSRGRELATTDWPADLVRDVETIAGRVGEDGAVIWLTVPLAGGSSPE